MTEDSSAGSAEPTEAEKESARAYSKAVDLLAMRPHFRAELARKLERRDFARPAVESTLDRLIELGYVDDLASARAFASQRAARQGWGPRRLVAELARRGVDEEYVRMAVDEVFAEGEGAMAREAATRWAARAGKGGGDQDRLARYLDRRGFSKSVIVEILQEFAADARLDDTRHGGSRSDHEEF